MNSCTFCARSSSVIIPILLLCLTGCATYEYDILRPPEFAQHIGHEKEVVIQSGMLQYRLQAVENRLVVRIFNQSADPVRFLGDQSAVNDPSGQAHALRGMMLLPGSYMKLILPPTSHLPSGGGPGYSGPGWADGLGRSDMTDGQPSLLAIDESGATPFNWPLDTDVRLLLTFQHGQNEPFTQEWIFRKQKRS